MDARIVVGVGNIYASEALYLAGIHPARAAGRISRARYERLAEAIRTVLAGVSPSDPLAFSAAVVVLLGTALGASALPARRISAAVPMKALRED